MVHNLKQVKGGGSYKIHTYFDWEHCCSKRVVDFILHGVLFGMKMILHRLTAG